MGLMGLASLIPAITGDFGKAFFFLAYDFLDENQQAQQREERRKIVEHKKRSSISQEELRSFVSWAFGEEVFHLDASNELVARLWNRRHSGTLFVYPQNGFEHNILQMMNLWIYLQKPLV